MNMRTPSSTVFLFKHTVEYMRSIVYNLGSHVCFDVSIVVHLSTQAPETRKSIAAHFSGTIFRCSGMPALAWCSCHIRWCLNASRF